MFNQDDFSNMQTGSMSDRERLEIDSDGKKLGDSRKEKQEQRLKDMENNYGRNKRGFGRNIGGRSSRSSSSGWLGFFIILLIVSGLIYLPIASSKGSLPEFFKGFTSQKAEYNMNAFINSIFKFKNDSDTAFNNITDKEGTSKKELDFYDKNAIYTDTVMGDLPEHKYVIFVYLGTEQDNIFKDWIESYEKEENLLNRVKIYRMPFEKAITNMYVEKAVIDNDYNIKEQPLMLIYGTNEDKRRVLDSTLTNSNTLSELKEYLATFQ